MPVIYSILSMINRSVLMNSYSTCTTEQSVADIFGEFNIDINAGELTASYPGWTWTLRRCDDFPSS